MKTFDKSSKLDHVAYDIRGPVLDEANRMIANGEKILRLNTGNPAEFGFTAPDEVIRDLIMNVRNSEGYDAASPNPHMILSARIILSQEPSQSPPYTLYDNLCPDTIFHPVRLL